MITGVGLILAAIGFLMVMPVSFVLQEVGKHRASDLFGIGGGLVFFLGMLAVAIGVASWVIAFAFEHMP